MVLSMLNEGPCIDSPGTKGLLSVLETEGLACRCSPPPMIVVVVDPKVVPLRVRVRSQSNPFSPASETGLGGEAFSGKNHLETRSGRGTVAIVLRFSAGLEGRRSEEIRDGKVRELSVDGESLENGESSADDSN